MPANNKANDLDTGTNIHVANLTSCTVTNRELNGAPSNVSSPTSNHPDRITISIEAKGRKDRAKLLSADLSEHISTGHKIQGRTVEVFKRSLEENLQNDRTTN